MDAPAAPPLVRLTEDDLYRRSTQYKHWSFTPAQLAALRQKTNIQASERVKANVARQRAQRAKNLDPVSASESSRGNTPGVENGSGGAGNGGAVGDKEVDCLTVAEEITILDKFCQTVLELGEYVSTVKLRDHYVTITPEIIVSQLHSNARTKGTHH
jgi:cyclin H